MANQYGKTWWGQQWLNALSKIDNSNRLPRGKTYANKGLVKNIEVKDNAINARVQGSQRSPYKIDITVPKFDSTQKGLIINEIQNNPALLAKLLNRELPPDLDDFARRNGIRIFPTTWRDFSMKCSCPDSAVPCKHLAAVIYVVANEIDKNPFLVFQLHAFDLLDALKSQNIGIQKGATVAVASVQDLVEEKPQKTVGLDEVAFEKLDFSKIEPLGEKLLKLLAPSPIFYEKDFKKNVEKIYKTIIKTTKEAYVEERPNKFVLDEVSLWDEIRFEFNEKMGFKTLEFQTDENESRQISFKNLYIERLRNTLSTTSLRKIEHASDSFRAVFWIHQFCKTLLENGGIIPQLLKTDKTEYRIRWIPATNNPTVKTLFESLIAITPANLVVINTGKKTGFQSSEQQLYTICSVFLNDMVATASMTAFGKISKYNRGNPIYVFEWIDEFFFMQETYDFNDFETRETPSAVQMWLNNFYITHKNFVPILRVEDNEERGVFEVDVLIEDKTLSGQAPIELKNLLKDKKYEKTRFEVLQDLMLLANHFSEINQVVNSHGTKKAIFDADSFVEVLLEILPVMQLFGIQILLPKSLKSWVRPGISGTLKGKAAYKIGSYLNLDQMLSFDWQVAVGDEVIDPQEFRNLVKNASGLVKIKDRYVLVEQEELQKLYKRLENPPKMTGVELLKTALAEEFQGNKVGLSKEVLELLKDLTQPQTIPLPHGLTANLRPYQQKGYEWMLKNTRLGFGSLIADDMGLGKTLQVISLLLKFKEDGIFEKKKGLIVVPTTLLTNWQKEIAKFAPSLKMASYHGTKRKLEIEDHDLIITTYGLVRSDLDKFKKIDWYCTVVDEAQNIKNPTTEQTKAVKTLKSDIKIAMSGTPVENRLSEFWSILDFANKGYLGNLSKFTDEFAKPIQLDRDQKQLDIFRKVTAPFLLRRLKTDKSIITDLPDKVENNHYSTLAKEQAALYEGVVKTTLEDIESSEGIARKGLILKLMTALKQIGNHPYQFTKKGDSNPELSGKALMMLDLLENVYEANEKVLIFTQYTEMGELLAKFIEDVYHTKPLFLHGGLDRKKRDEMVDRFQNDRQTDTFILSLKAGGTGLNLTQANHVIHYDLWWNPAVEAQATDRAFRIGQNKNVMVYRLINQGTFEEKIDEMINRKKDLANMSVQTGETWLGDLSNEDLKDLVKLDF